jgi:hypothetical protein
MIAEVLHMCHIEISSKNVCVVCVYYCRTYYKAVRVGGGGGTMEDMCYEGLRAEACVD